MSNATDKQVDALVDFVAAEIMRLLAQPNTIPTNLPEDARLSTAAVMAYERASSMSCEELDAIIQALAGGAA